jgi:DNA-binding transcriptional LysR family regulator
VRVGAPPTVGMRLLPAALSLFHARYPGPEILLREEGTGELLSLIEQGELDLAVVILPVSSAALEATPLFEEDIVVAVGARHRLAGEHSVAMADPAHEPFLLLGEGYELRRTTLDACREAGFQPRVVLEGGEMDTVLNLAATGFGVALVPALAVNPGGPLVGLRIADQTRRRSLGVVRLRERWFTAAARAFRDCLVEQTPGPDLVARP